MNNSIEFLARFYKSSSSIFRNLLTKKLIHIVILRNTTVISRDITVISQNHGDD